MTDREAFEAWMRTPCPDDYECDPKWAEYIWQAAKATAPAWHPAPTLSGLWLYSITGNATQINIANKHAYLHLSGNWYGPIPPSNL